jgi:hypothetical protein
MPAPVPSDLLVRLGSPATLRLGGDGPAVPVARVQLRMADLDALLGGGLPCGYLSEIVGPPSSGKTALLYMLLAATTARGEVAALVDPSDAFCPPHAAAAGVDLARTLWVRPATVRDGLRCAELLLEAGGFETVAVDLGNAVAAAGTARAGRLGAGTWPRLARTAARSGAAFVLLGRERMAGTFAAFGLVLRPRHQHWSQRGGGPVLFDGLETEAVLVRNRLGAPGRTAIVRAAAS